MTSDFTVAVHALVYLNRKSAVASSEELAHNICTNPSRVRKIMARLKSAGLVTTKEGAVGGGYHFCGDPDKTDLLQIFKAVSDHIISPGWQSGDPKTDCLIASGMARVMDGIFAELDTLCQGALAQITISRIDTELSMQK